MRCPAARYFDAKPSRIAEPPRKSFGGYYLDIVATGRGTDDTVLDIALVNAQSHLGEKEQVRAPRLLDLDAYFDRIQWRPDHAVARKLAVILRRRCRRGESGSSCGWGRRRFLFA
jgi:hypothetical protein